MKKLILLLFIPFVSLGQEVVLNEYYDDGKKVIEKTWKENFTFFCYQNAKVSMRENVAENYCDCALEKVMEKYSSGEEADKETPNMTIKEVQALYQPCYNNAIR